MEEKRNDRRMGLSAKLLIKNMNDSESQVEEAAIEVLDVSKSGVGYVCGTIFIGLPEMNAKRIEVYDLLGRINSEEA